MSEGAIDGTAWERRWIAAANVRGSAILCLAILLLALAVIALVPLRVKTDVPASSIVSEHGVAYQFQPQFRLLPGYRVRSDTALANTASSLILFENGTPLGPAHSLHETIRTAGGGAYSHWGRAVIFSTRDGSDPRANGRAYHVEARAALPRWLRSLMLLASGAGCVLILALLRAHLYRFGTAALSALRPRAWSKPARGKAISPTTLYLTGFAASALILTLCTALAPTYRLDIKPQAMNAYGERGVSAMLSFPVRFPFQVTADVSGAAFASSLELYEDGVRLGPAHTDHDSISKFAGGRFSHWYGGIIFSASDGSDPRTNGRHYQVVVEASTNAVLVAAGFVVCTFCLIGLYATGSDRTRFWLRVCAVGAAALAGVYVFYEQYALTHFLPLFTPDSESYLAIGVRGWITPTIYRLLHLADDTGRSFVPFQLLAMLAGFATLAYAIARSTTSLIVGLLAFLVLAFDGHLVVNSLSIMSEAFFIAALTFHAAFVILTLEDRRIGWAIAAGLAAGFAAVVRPLGLCFVLVLPLLALLLHDRRIRITLACCGGAAAVLVVSAAPGWMARDRGLDTITGLAVLGHVLHLADENTPTSHPELMRQILPTPAARQALRDADFPQEYWLKSQHEYNDLLWRNATPKLLAYVQQKRAAGDTSIAANSTAISISLSVILDKPLPFIRLMAAQVWGLWYIEKTRYPVPLGPLVHSWINDVVGSYENMVTAKTLIAEGYDLRGETAHLAAGATDSTLARLLKRLSRYVIYMSVVASPLLVLAMPIWAAGLLLRRRTISPLLASAAFSATLLLSYALVMAATQPALERYSIVLHPLVMTLFLLSVWWTLSALVSLVGGDAMRSRFLHALPIRRLRRAPAS